MPIPVTFGPPDYEPQIGLERIGPHSFRAKPLREVQYVGPQERPAPIVGTIERELTIHTSEELPDVVCINGVEYRPKKD